ncbi:hypothetical protein GN956_G16915 [Arapaima gigas]
MFTVSLIAAILGKVVYSQPQLSVNPTVIRLRDSVHLTCEAPQGLHEDQTQYTSGDSPFSDQVRVTVNGGPAATPPSSYRSATSPPPSLSFPAENYVSRFLWRRILGALVILVALIFIVDHLLFTRCPSGSSRRSREPQEDIGEF